MKKIILLFILLKNIFSLGKKKKYTSEEGIKFIMEREGFSKNVYKGQGNIDTIGYGFTSSCESLIGRKIEEIKDLSEEEGKNILEYLLTHKYENLVNKYDIIYRFNQNQYDALVSFAYNYGEIDKLTNYGTRTLEEISSSLLDIDFMTVNGVKNNDLENRRNLEKNLFDKPLLPNSNKMTINKYISTSGISSLLINENNSQKIGEDTEEENIGVIYYDNQNGNTMNTYCYKYYSTNEELVCSPYYPILEGEYIIKLPKIGIFSNGDSVLPFDLTNYMYNNQNNEPDGLSEVEDYRIKIYNVNFPLIMNMNIFQDYLEITFFIDHMFLYITKKRKLNLLIKLK